MRPLHHRGGAVLAMALCLAGCSKPSDAPPAASQAAAAAPAASGIAWQHASTGAEVDAAFAQARHEGRPVFLYWGARWCPPCNQMKATVFNRLDFIERSRAFVPVYIDGDSPGAQALGARFKVSGYPTTLLFSPAGAEVTRLPGEVDAAQYTQLLTLGMNARRPVAQVLADARRGSPSLTANDWKLLAFYSWETDSRDQALVPPAELPALLRRLADACPAGESQTATRLRLKALAAVDAKTTPPAGEATRRQVLAVLADAGAARAQMDVLTNSPAEIVDALSRAGAPERAPLRAAFDAALQRLAADATLSRADRMTALLGRVALARQDGGAIPAPLRNEVREQAARADREITDGYERQAVITAAAELLSRAGLADESDALLKANLAKSHSPYYLMADLAENARQRGDAAGALSWWQQAFDGAQGPATRLQWGAAYVKALVALSPADEARVERVVGQVLTEAAGQSDAFEDRSGRSLQRIGQQLQAWNRDGTHAAAVARLRARLDAVCAPLAAADPQRARCAAVFSAASRPASAPAS